MAMHDKYAVSYSTISSTFCVLQVARFVYITSNPRTVNVQAPATPPKSHSSPSWPILFMLESSLQSKNVIIVRTWQAVALKLQSEQKYGICTTENNI